MIIKRIILAGHLEFKIIPLSQINLERQDLRVFWSEEVILLGVYLGNNDFLSLNDEFQKIGDFVNFQDRLAFQVGEKRVALYRVGNQVEIKIL